MPQFTIPPWQKAVGVVAVLFGFLTLFKSGGILFDLEGAKRAAGAYVPFVVQFNFVAGFFYILGGAGIWLGRRGACLLSGLIALATLLAAAAFAFHISQGGSYEVKTVMALVVRAGFWAVVAITLHRSRR
jgi:uncharacterized membrane protein